jgi:TolB-like protein
MNRRVASALALVLACTASPLRAQCPDGTPPPCGPRVAPALVVRPFASRSVDSGDAYLASTLTEDVTTALASTRGLRLVTAAARGRADFTLDGTVRRSGGSLFVTAQLARTADGMILWRHAQPWAVRDLGRIPDSVASGALLALGLTYHPRAAIRTEDPDLYDQYARGRYMADRRNQPAMHRAVALFQDLIARDSTSPYGWMGLARALQAARGWGYAVPGLPRDSMLPALIAAADRAVELSPGNVDLWLMRGEIARAVDPTSRSASLLAFRRAIAADSLSVEAWYRYGLGLEETGDSAAAGEAFRRATDLGPTDAQALSWMALHEFWARRYDAAATWADSAITLDPTLALARFAAGNIAFRRGRLDEADDQGLAAERLSSGPDHQWGRLVRIHVLLARGDSAGARAMVRGAAAVGDSTLTLHLALALGESFAALGQPDSALAWLSRYQPIRDTHYQLHLRCEPGLDPLRSDPRFQALLTR